MKNEDKIKELVEILSREALINGKQGVTAQEIESKLGLKRNVISHHLNRLVEDGIVIKTKTRPVYFMYRDSIEELNEKTIENHEIDIFNTVIGHDGSLAEVIDQCKAATMYPGKGLPILITGSSGVGKSFLARLIFEYAKSKGVIKEDAKFVVFNCADYANNKELLASKLFGYVKGAFTGADADSVGIIEEANNSYLFLDEIHRLPPEGQEKLFLLLDKGKYSRVGENGTLRDANVRLICATTENIKEVLIDTFVRRIPIVTTIPNISIRPVDEKIQLIKRFYAEESKVIDKDIKVSKRVINFLLSNNFVGNVGGLKNTIKYSCASAFRSSTEDSIFIDLENLHNKVIKDGSPTKEYYNMESLIIPRDTEDVSYISSKDKKELVSKYYDTIEELFQITKDYEGGIINSWEYKKWVGIKLNKISENIYFKQDSERDSIRYKVMVSVAEKALGFLETNYGVKCYGNMVQVLATYLLFFKKTNNMYINEIIEKKEYILKVFKERKFKYNNMATRLLKIIEEGSQCEYGINGELFLTLFIYNISREETFNEINGVIVAHGYSTASSIASVVNQLLEEYVFEAFDMPIDMEPREIIEKINQYIQKVDTNKGTIFLVDMGSLFEIYPMIRESFNGEVAVINNITTQLALVVGDMIIKGESVQGIINTAVEGNKIGYKYYEHKAKRKAIITTCASGVGAAKKLRDIIKGCLGDEEIEVIPYDYFKLKNRGLKNDVFIDFDVKLIISTLEIELDKVDSILLSDIFVPDTEQRLRSILSELVQYNSVDSIINNLIKMLSLQNIISKIIILNPEKVIDTTERILNLMEIALNYEFTSDLRLTLFIHIAVMIERLVLDKENIEDSVIENIEKYDRNEFKLLHKLFGSELKEYSIKIPDSEIYLLMGILNNKYKKI